MNMTLSGKKWLAWFCATLILLTLLCVAVTYWVDPFFQYRAKKEGYFFNAQYTAAGLIKNYDYDTLIFGSSMAQNFNMELFRKELGCAPLHIGLGGMTEDELLDFISLAARTGKAEKYFINIDISCFHGNGINRTVPYLMGDGVLDRLQYSLSYESLFRILPVDIGLSLARRAGISLPYSYRYKTDADYFGWWGDEYAFGEEVVLAGRETGEYAVSDVDLTNLPERMRAEIDRFFEGIQVWDREVTFFFPPYSSLFWVDAQDNGYFDTYMDAKAYFVGKAETMGAEVYDFQSAEFTQNLDFYKDTTHYSPDKNDWMVECFASGAFRVTMDSVDACREKLTANTQEFRERMEGGADGSAQ